MDSDTHSSSLHSVLVILLVLLVAVLITVSLYFLLRRLRHRVSVSPVLHSVAPSSSSTTECAICLSPFEPEENLRHLPLCCHAFHEDCIATWLVSNQTCPLCRSPLSASSEDVASPVASLVASVGHDGSRSWLRDISTRALSFRGSARFATGSSRRSSQVVDLEAGQEISEYFHWLSQL